MRSAASALRPRSSSLSTILIPPSTAAPKCATACAAARNAACGSDSARRAASAQLSLDLPQLAVQLAPHPDRALLQSLQLRQPVLGRLLRRGCLLPLHGEDRPRVPIDVGVRSFRDALPARRDVLAEVLL